MARYTFLPVAQFVSNCVGAGELGGLDERAGVVSSAHASHKGHAHGLVGVGLLRVKVQPREQQGVVPTPRAALWGEDEV